MTSRALRWSLIFVAVAGIVRLAVTLRPHSEPELALFYASERASVPEGALLQAEGDWRVYLALDGRIHWIDSEETFRNLGFRAKDVRTIPAADLAGYPQGEPVTGHTQVILPTEAKVLPDLAPLAPYELRLAIVNGRRVIRFTGSFWNKGYRQFRLVSRNQISGTSGTSEDVYQQIQSEDGSLRNVFVGTFIWHPAHGHHHYDDFGEYLLEPATVVPGTRLLTPSTRKKTTFCLRDDERMPADVPNVPEVPVFTTCGPDGQGVSPGWIDVYGYFLPDQYVDVQDLLPGIYALSFFLDPRQRFIEERADNNISTTLIELDAEHGILRTIASLAPFKTLRNTAADGTLLRDVESGKVFVVSGGRKRWIRSVDIFTSYGFRWEAVYPVTAAMAAAFDDQLLIRRRGTDEVYVLNEHGRRRHVPSSEVFASYGWSVNDIADINSLDFAAYPEGNFIMLPGDAQVYQVNGTEKRPAGTLSVLQTLNVDLDGLFIVNQTDFDSYTTVPTP